MRNLIIIGGLPVAWLHAANILGNIFHFMAVYG